MKDLEAERLEAHAHVHSSDPASFYRTLGRLEREESDREEIRNVRAKLKEVRDLPKRGTEPQVWLASSNLVCAILNMNNVSAEQRRFPLATLPV
jgi:hypothetical protein